jgi:transcriptional regulator with XRE-family HTH domain
MAIGQNLKRLRASLGMSQMGLAVGAGLSLSVVTQIEQGLNRDPRGSTLQGLARALGVTVDELLQETGEENAIPAEEDAAPRKKRIKKGS